MARATGTKRAILDATLELAATKGISGTTMDEVAERAGVAKGSLYYNFSSKDRLFEELLLEGVGALAEILRAARGDLRGRAAIEALVGALLDRIASNPALAKLMASEIFRTDRTWQKSLFALRHEALTVFAEAIAEAKPESRDHGTCGLMASSVFGAVLMAGLEWLVFEPERPRDEVAAAILDSLSGGLLGGDRPAPR
ncbi:TetR/AcrR family transcriptional regulator [Cryobacterium sp. TMT1-21]|uniref:TetR/AcrR family transcriptional regulator n=1 Tax=Cryobacterium shii TaxID=1259235 RepID=A0AAQ2C621_9MICO|nr:MULTISPECIES: TetR/AcrR family transcriptional regulator [Cryobacterium]TFC46562.1 TetR/AcrR family transcriptional regulator [Cryobacterium shii]TFC82679.1 TetR/AcrR family transcriptional regulator [Cryobacterium sp. TmT2-59]TFD12105.1 TetR/AcrR family transcriptional regulator [Cryobacterium sp. TMT1-21]TFD12287.1 TetR/AcrR family transcriptional regulator [Cryobacterium sp. TMT4-10]TFD19334.1 TetR/AcrR family transcriptional regulator [Cryobacterium sp. TMT2-23]